MITMDVTALPAADANRVWALEFDSEHGHVQAFGESEVYYYLPRCGAGPTLESGVTGGCYSEPQIIGDVQIWNAEEHFLAIFPDESSMRAGGRQLAAAWGDELPVGVHRVIA
jgi:hypothetical protein